MLKPFHEQLPMTDAPIRVFTSACDGSDAIVTHPHWHGEVEILHIRKGCALTCLDGATFIAGADDIIIIWNDQIHSAYSLESQACVIDVYQFPTAQYRSLQFTAPLMPGNRFYPEVRTALELCKQEMGMQDSASACAIKAQVYALYTLLLRNCIHLPCRDGRKAGHKDTVGALFDLISLRYREPLTLADAAQAVHLSIPQMMRVFKNATGMTFKHYLNLYRIDRSISLLTGGMSVTETALECGFDNVNTFIRLFKQHKSCTPLQFVRSQRQQRTLHR